MKFIKRLNVGFCAVLSLFLFNITAFAEEFSEEDKYAFGIMPIWLFLLILAGATAAAIVIIVEIVKKKNK